MVFCLVSQFFRKNCIIFSRMLSSITGFLLSDLIFSLLNLHLCLSPLSVCQPMSIRLSMIVNYRYKHAQQSVDDTPSASSFHDI